MRWATRCVHGATDTDAPMQVRRSFKKFWALSKPMPEWRTIQEASPGRRAQAKHRKHRKHSRVEIFCYERLPKHAQAILQRQHAFKVT